MVATTAKFLSATSSSQFLGFSPRAFYVFILKGQLTREGAPAAKGVSERHAVPPD